MDALTYRTDGATIAQITREVSERIGPTPASSIRSYLRLNTPRLFEKIDRGHYRVREEAQPALPLMDQRNGTATLRAAAPREAFRFGNATLIHGDCFQWLAIAQTNSIEAVVTDPPYGLVEYSEIEQNKLREGRGGVWRIPPSFDGNKRSPLPRFTVLSREDITELERFFFMGAFAVSGSRSWCARDRRFQSFALVCRCECRNTRWIRASRRNHSTHNDDARR